MFGEHSKRVAPARVPCSQKSITLKYFNFRLSVTISKQFVYKVIKMSAEDDLDAYENHMLNEHPEEIEAEAAEIDEDVDDIIKGTISEGTRDTYEKIEKTLVKFLSDNYPHCLEGVKVLLPLAKAILKAYFTHISRHANGKLKAKSTVSNYLSSFVWLYLKRDMDVDPPTKRYLSVYRSYYKRTHQKAVKVGDADEEDGKRHFSFTAYCYIAVLMMAVPTDFWYAASYFLILWNLMCRGTSVGTLRFEHMFWEDDCLKVKIPASKSNQTGEKEYDKAVYANPLEPSICPILSIAIYLFSRTEHIIDIGRVFDSDCAESNFGKFLRNLLHGPDIDTHILGVHPDDLGTHSPRKASPTYCQQFPQGPTTDTIKLRMGHSLGKTRDAYIHPEAFSDRFLGRIAAGLPYNDINFGTLPPHFKPTVILTEQFWREVVADYDKMPHPFRSALPFLLASLVYHEEFWEAKLSAKHPLRVSPVFTNGCIAQLRGDVICEFGKLYCPVTGLRASGIPPTVNQLVKLTELEANQVAMTEEINSLNTRFAQRLTEAQDRILGKYHCYFDHLLLYIIY
jgi:hypothetical protein